MHAERFKCKKDVNKIGHQYIVLAFCFFGHFNLILDSPSLSMLVKLDDLPFRLFQWAL